MEIIRVEPAAEGRRFHPILFNPIDGGLPESTPHEVVQPARRSINTALTPVIVKSGTTKLSVMSARNPMLIGPSAPPISPAEK